jgi:hypothetical protein
MYIKFVSTIAHLIDSANMLQLPLPATLLEWVTRTDTFSPSHHHIHLHESLLISSLLASPLPTRAIVRDNSKAHSKTHKKEKASLKKTSNPNGKRSDKKNNKKEKLTKALRSDKGATTTTVEDPKVHHKSQIRAASVVQSKKELRHNNRMQADTVATDVNKKLRELEQQKLQNMNEKLHNLQLHMQQQEQELQAKHLQHMHAQLEKLLQLQQKQQQQQTQIGDASSEVDADKTDDDQDQLQTITLPSSPNNIPEPFTSSTQYVDRSTQNYNYDVSASNYKYYDTSNRLLKMPNMEPPPEVTAG